jgi:hypothetical protein
MWGAWPMCSRAAGESARRIGRVLAVLVGTALALGSSAAAATRPGAVGPHPPQFSHCPAQLPAT